MSTERAGAAVDSAVEPLGFAVGIALFAILALVGNAIGSMLRYPDIGAAVFFPPYAALTAALVLSPRRQWIWYIGVGTAAHFLTHWPRWSASWVLLADVANIYRAIVAAVLLRQLFKGPPRLDGVADVARFVFAAAIVAPAIGATLGAANVVLHGGSATYWQPWRAWFMSNALTGLTMLPTFVLGAEYLMKSRMGVLEWRRVTETASLVAALALTSAIAFLAPSGSRWHFALFLYAPLPVLIWTALRFGPTAACGALTIVSIVAILSADRSAGPFFVSSPDERMLIVQLFVLLSALPVLAIVGISGARQRVVQLHRALLASLHDHVAILDAHGVIVEVNESWRRFADAAVGAPYHAACIGDNFVRACIDGDAEHGGPGKRAADGATNVLAGDVDRFEMEYDCHHGDSLRRCALSVERLERPDGGAVVIRADATARYQAEREIEEQRRQLSHLARVASLGQLSGALAHELNQPLASIASNAEAARVLLSRESPDVSELDLILRDIAVEDRRAALVIRRLRGLLKRGETRIQPIDAGELVDEVLELAHAELLARHVAVRVVVSPVLPRLLVDRIQLQQVLLNLILNAAEAMLTTGAADRAIRLVVQSEPGANLRFSVSDCGTGIPASVVDHLFEPFVTTKPQGLGLGLSISRAIVGAHGGRLWAENNADGGATLHCVLPSEAHAGAPAVDRRGPGASTRITGAAIARA
jgi:signal transduction histidine kinase/integral membrane sensor domain MASE1